MMKKHKQALWAKEAFRGEERLQSCYLESFNDFLKSFWMDNSEEIAILLWKNLLNGSPQLAREYLIALDAIIAHPPPNLIELMQQNGWIILYHEPDPATVIPYTFSEHVEWLTQMTARWRRICEQERASPAGVLRSVLQDFWIDRSDAMVLSEWKRYVKQAPRQAQIILQSLAAVIDAPPPDFAARRRAVRNYCKHTAGFSGRCPNTSIMMETEPSQGRIHSQSMSNGLDK